jgi:hypothetical protein
MNLFRSNAGLAPAVGYKQILNIVDASGVAEVHCNGDVVIGGLFDGAVIIITGNSEPAYNNTQISAGNPALSTFNAGTFAGAGTGGTWDYFHPSAVGAVSNTPLGIDISFNGLVNASDPGGLTVTINGVEVVIDGAAGGSGVVSVTLNAANPIAHGDVVGVSYDFNLGNWADANATLIPSFGVGVTNNN